MTQDSNVENNTIQYNTRQYIMEVNVLLISMDEFSYFKIKSLGLLFTFYGFTLIKQKSLFKN